MVISFLIYNFLKGNEKNLSKEKQLKYPKVDNTDFGDTKFITALEDPSHEMH